MSMIEYLTGLEQRRQNKNIELIASENFVSDRVLELMGSIWTNKYAEGYPQVATTLGRAGRYYGGCEYADQLENYCRLKWAEVFDTHYHVNVQPHSGSQANMAAYAAVLNPGDTILAMDLSAGGHLTHSSSVSFVSKFYNVVTYGVTKDGYIDENEIFEKVIEYKPKAVVVGASSYSREIKYGRIAQAINQAAMIGGIETPYIIVDMAHPAGLIAAGLLESPFGYADIITTTTHKTLRGPRGGLIFCKPELAKKVDSAVFPRNQGGPLLHIIAAKAVCAEEALEDSFKEYAEQVIKNSKAMAQRFLKYGYKIVSNGTDNHMFLLDLTGTGMTGKELEEKLDEKGITLNKNAIPFDELPPSQASGVRIGTAAMTTKGFKEKDFEQIAEIIIGIIENNKETI